MKVKKIIKERKESIAAKWVGRIFDSYPPERRQFLLENKDINSNPTGVTIISEINNILNELVAEKHSEKLNDYLENIIKIRLMQDYSPSNCVGFIMYIKDIIRDEIKNEKLDFKLISEIFVIESLVDDFALIGFDIYLQQKEKIFGASEQKTLKISNRDIESNHFSNE